MHLSIARLCLDCQEIHDADRCPVCTSEAFGFITRWVKVDAPAGVTPQEKPGGRASKVDSYREILNPTPQRSRAAGWLRKGGLVVAAGYLARWGWQIAAQHSRSSQRTPAEAETSIDRDSSSARSRSSRSAPSIRPLDS